MSANVPAQRRTPRQYAADAVLVAMALFVWWYWGFATASASPSIPDWFWPIDRGLGLAAVVALWWSRRFPTAVALIAVIPGALSASAGFAAVAAVYRAGSRGRPAHAIGVTALHLGTALPYHALFPVVGVDWTTWFVFIPLVYVLALTVGLLVRARRQVVEGLRARAEDARERYERELVLQRRAERERIASEMHDVLAHRISLVSVHAGALEFRTSPGQSPPSPGEVHEAASVIRANAHLAAEELRGVLDVLRDEPADADAGIEPPQPRLDRLPHLLADAEAAGQRVSLALDDGVGASLSASEQRTVYRVVQEGLTNARKHAPGAPVAVRIARGDAGVSVTVENAVPVGVTESEIPGVGTGISGLEERLRIEGGRLRRELEGGRFRLRAELVGRGSAT